MFSDKKNKRTSKARKLEKKADRFLAKNKKQKAFETYQKALDLDGSRTELYDKIIKLHQEYSDNWGEDDFAYNLDLTMSKQEVQDPAYKRVNARMEPESLEIKKLIKQMFAAKNPTQETKFVEEIVNKGDEALYPLIDFILEFKNIGKKLKSKLNKMKSDK